MPSHRATPSPNPTRNIATRNVIQKSALLLESVSTACIVRGLAPVLNGSVSAPTRARLHTDVEGPGTKRTYRINRVVPDRAVAQNPREPNEGSGGEKDQKKPVRR